jgi:putative hemolysin
MAPVLLILLAVAGMVGVQVMGTFDEERAEYRQADDWCLDHGGEVQPEGRGELLFAIECELPNGTVVDPYHYVEADDPGS